MKRILSSGYIKKIDSNGTDNILVETIKDLHPEYKGMKFPIQQFFQDGNVDALEHYNFTFKLKIPNSLLCIFRSHRIAVITTLPEVELDAYIPPEFLINWNKMPLKENSELYTKFQNVYKYIFNFFGKLVNQNVALHQLEFILPGGSWAEFYLTINLNDLMNFLRVSLNTQIPEVKEIAQALLGYFQEEFPLTSSIFLNQNFPRR